jgi:hypothetical protein
MENHDTDLDTTIALNEIKEIFEGHGIRCAVHEDWVLPNGNLPALRAVWHPRNANMGQLDIQLLIEPGVMIEECFAGVGEGEAACRDALGNFLVNSLHVLLTAFWGIDGANHVTVGEWEIAGKPYHAYLGNVGVRASAGVHVPIPKNLLAEIEAVVKLENLMGKTHWAHTFFSNINGEQTFEALLGNKYWENGMDCLKNIQWTEREGYYSIRHFLVLRAIE